MPGEYDRYNMKRSISLTANIVGEDLGRVAGRVSRGHRAGRDAAQGGDRRRPRARSSRCGRCSPGSRSGSRCPIVVILLLLTANFQSVRLALVAVSTAPAVVCGRGRRPLAHRDDDQHPVVHGGDHGHRRRGRERHPARDLRRAAPPRGRGRGGRRRGARGEGPAPADPHDELRHDRRDGPDGPRLGRGGRADRRRSAGPSSAGSSPRPLATLLVLPSVFALVQGRAGRHSASVDPDDPESRYFDRAAAKPRRGLGERRRPRRSRPIGAASGGIAPDAATRSIGHENRRLRREHGPCRRDDTGGGEPRRPRRARPRSDAGCGKPTGEATARAATAGPRTVARVATVTPERTTVRRTTEQPGQIEAVEVDADPREARGLRRERRRRHRRPGEEGPGARRAPRPRGRGRPQAEAGDDRAGRGREEAGRGDRRGRPGGGRERRGEGRGDPGRHPQGRGGRRPLAVGVRPHRAAVPRAGPDREPPRRDPEQAHGGRGGPGGGPGPGQVRRGRARRGQGPASTRPARTSRPPPRTSRSPASRPSGPRRWRATRRSSPPSTAS